jgi:hypothetical protein
MQAIKAGISDMIRALQTENQPCSCMYAAPIEGGALGRSEDQYTTLFMMPFYSALQYEDSSNC